MTRLDQMPEITDQVLSGLRADESLKYKIFQKAAGVSDTPVRKSSRIPIAVLCSISAVMIAAFVLLNPLANQNSLSGGQQVSSAVYDSPAINHIPAGTVLPESPLKDENEKTSSEIRANDESEEETEEESGEDPEQKGDTTETN